MWKRDISGRGSSRARLRRYITAGEDPMDYIHTFRIQMFLGSILGSTSIVLYPVVRWYEEKWEINFFQKSLLLSMGE